MKEGIIERPDGRLVEIEPDVRIIHVNQSNDGVKASTVLGQLVQYISLVDILENVKKGVQYVVQVPTHLQKDIDSGKFTMLHGERTGHTWATIVEKLPDGKNKIIANCPIKEETFYHGNPIQDFAKGLANLRLQKQMAALAKQLGKAYDAILRVEAGQKADRIGQLRAGREGIIHALKMKNTEKRELAVAVARGSLQEAQGRIGEVLKQKIADFKTVPRTYVGRFVSEFIHDDFLDKRDDEYHVIMEYYDLYIQATKLIAESFIICNELESAKSVFDECASFIKHDLDFSRVQTILRSHPKMTPKDLFFYKASQHVAEDKAICLEDAKPYDYIELLVDGKDLLEVIEDDENK